MGDLMDWLTPKQIDWTLLGFLGAGISIGIRLGRGEKINKWALVTTLATGAAVAGTATEALTNAAGLEPFWAGAVALLLGLMAMGFVINAYDGKIPIINKWMGGANGSDNEKPR